MKTIAKNRRKRIAEISAAVVRCRVFTLGNNFCGAELPQDAAWAALQQCDFAKLIEVSGTRWTVQVHGNKWYELYA